MLPGAGLESGLLEQGRNRIDGVEHARNALNPSCQKRSAKVLDVHDVAIARLERHEFFEFAMQGIRRLERQVSWHCGNRVAQGPHTAQRKDMHRFAAFADRHIGEP